MEDEETKQLLREILAAQREQLALYQRNVEDQEKLLQTYVSDSASYRQRSEKWELENTGYRWALAIRVVTMVGVVLLLGYVVLFGLHAH